MRDMQTQIETLQIGEQELTERVETQSTQNLSVMSAMERKSDKYVGVFEKTNSKCA
jgi:hypothetical protein